MSDNLLAILGLVISAVTAVVPIVIKRMELSAAGNVPETLPAPTTSRSTAPATDATNYGLALRHVAILQFVANMIGLLIGVAFGLSGGTMETLFPIILIIGMIVLSAGFFWSGAAVDKAVRWRHLTVVAIGVALATLLLNSLFLQVPLTLMAVAFAFVQTFISMGIGGAIANSVKN